MIKPKIAIMVSGQLRDYNQNYNLWKESVDILFKDFDYDLYGQTWQDQPTPINVGEFVSFNKHDQNIIFDTLVNGNIFNKIPFNSEWTNRPEFRNTLMGRGQTTLDQWLKDIITPAYSQIFGLQLCSLGVNKHYDMYVRYRWDNQIANWEYEDNADAWHRTLLDFAKWDHSFKHSITDERKSVCTFTPGVFHTDCRFIQDMCFLYKNDLQNSLNTDQFDWNYILTKIVEKLQFSPTAHELWAEFLIALNQSVLINGPMCVTHSKDGLSHYKPHKQWNI